MKLILELNEEQAKALERVCELGIRCALGQFRELIEWVKGVGEGGRDLEEMVEADLRQHFWPNEMTPNMSWGLGSPKVSQDAHAAYEIGRMIESTRRKANGETGWSVRLDTPLHYSGYGLPKVRVE